jgi:nitrate reductase beta subunit
MGLFLYDADAVLAAASVENEQDLYQAQLDVMLDPFDPGVVAAARADGMAEDWITAAQASPVYQLAKIFKVALPLHPEYRTMPMVWYIPPLSPVVDVVANTGHDGEDAGNLFAAIDALRIPIEYLAGLFTAGDTDVVDGVLRRLAAMRSYMRAVNLSEPTDPRIPEAVGLTEGQLVALFRLLAIAKYADRYVIPTAHQEQASTLEESALDGCSLDFEGGPGMGTTTPVGEVRYDPAAVESFHLTRQRAEADRHDSLPDGAGGGKKP